METSENKMNVKKSGIEKKKKMRILRIVILPWGLLVLAFASLLELFVSSNLSLSFIELVGAPVWCIAVRTAKKDIQKVMDTLSVSSD